MGLWFVVCREMGLEQVQTLVATHISAEPLPVGPGQWQGDNAILEEYKAVLQDCLSKQAKGIEQLSDPLEKVPFAIDTRPISEQRSE